jgi:hypothetical protein
MLRKKNGFLDSNDFRRLKGIEVNLPSHHLYNNNGKRVHRIIANLDKSGGDDGRISNLNSDLSPWNRSESGIRSRFGD